MKIELGRSVFGSMATNKKAALACALLVESLVVTLAQAAGSDPGLVVEARIPLGDVRGRIDHLAYDARRERLFVAELESGSVSVVDLLAQKVQYRIPGLDEPQGVAYSARADTLYIATGGDGAVRAYRGERLVAGPTIRLGSDADNVRVDPDETRVYVGHGAGAIAALDPRTLRKLAEWRFPEHPESFQLEAEGDRIFVNVPGAQAINVFKRSPGSPVTRWPAKEAASNFPMALDPGGRLLFTVFRNPPTLSVRSTEDGDRLASVKVCGDADDVFVDDRRRRAYVVCGEGAVEVFNLVGSLPTSLGRIATAPGARTGLFVQQLDRLIVAVRATGSSQAEVWMLRPTD